MARKSSLLAIMEVWIIVIRRHYRSVGEEREDEEWWIIVELRFDEKWIKFGKAHPPPLLLLHFGTQWLASTKYVLESVVELMDPSMGHKKSNQFSIVPLDLPTCASTAVEEEENMRTISTRTNGQWCPILFSTERTCISGGQLKLAFLGSRIIESMQRKMDPLIRNVRHQLINGLWKV